MSANYDNAEYSRLLSPGRVPPEERSEAGDALTALPALTAFSLADFERRVRACETPRRLDMLHTRMLRTVPVRQRASYIALLNQRDEELSFRGFGTT